MPANSWTMCVSESGGNVFLKESSMRRFSGAKCKISRAESI